MRRALAMLLAGGALLAAGAADSRPHFEDRVVALDVTHQAWDEYRPWVKKDPSTRSAAGVVVENDLLLTRAQIVANATLIQAERGGDGLPWAARVVHVDPEIDLALIAVEDPAFFEGLEPVRLAKRAPTRGSLEIVRWRDRQLEVADGRVATVEVRGNRYGNIEHAFVELSTDLENGGWSEPVFDGDALIGLTESQDGQRASLVPPEILRAYLERARAALAGGEYAGFGGLDVLWQRNQDRALTRYLGLEGPARGVLVRSAPRGGSACGALQPRDILLELEGQRIDAIGNVSHPRYGRIRFTQLAIEGHAPGDRIRTRVLRDGREREIEIEIERYGSESRLIPWRRDGQPPAYFIGGGLVFRELDGPYLRSWGPDWDERAPTDLVIEYRLAAHAQTPERRRVIILVGVLPDWYNLGYHDVSNMIVTHVNGVPVDSIRDLAAAFAAPEPGPEGAPGFHVVRFAANNSLAELVLDARLYAEASARILAAYNVPEPVRLGKDPSSFDDLGPACDGRTDEIRPSQTRSGEGEASDATVASSARGSRRPR